MPSCAAGHLEHNENGRVLAVTIWRGGIRRLALARRIRVLAENAGTSTTGAAEHGDRRNSRRVWSVISFFHNNFM